MAKKEITVTFKLPEEMHDWLCKTVTKIDRNKSEFIRCALLLSSDTIEKNPSLIDRIQFVDRIQ